MTSLFWVMTPFFKGHGDSSHFVHHSILLGAQPLADTPRASTLRNRHQKSLRRALTRSIAIKQTEKPAGTGPPLQRKNRQGTSEAKAPSEGVPRSRLLPLCKKGQEEAQVKPRGAGRCLAKWGENAGMPGKMREENKKSKQISTWNSHPDS